MKRIREWIDKKPHGMYGIDTILMARHCIFNHCNEENLRDGEWIPIYEIKMIGGLYIISSQKPDIKKVGLITLTDVYAANEWQSEMVINRDCIEYVREMK